MLETCGFGDINVVFQRDGDERIRRVCVHTTPRAHVSYEKILPRKKERMSIYGGERR